MKKIFYILTLIMSITVMEIKAQPTCDRRELIEWYTSNIGVSEDTGNNDGTIIEAWQKIGDMNLIPWCGAFFISGYVFSHIDIPKPPAYYFYTPNIAKTGKAVYKQGKEIENVLPGDAILIYNNNLGRIAHVGAVLDWQGSSSQCVSVEGNTNAAGSREGNISAVRIRYKDMIYQVNNIMI